MRILITGGCGFLGHHVVEHFLKNTDDQILVPTRRSGYDIAIFDNLTYASHGLDRLRDIQALDGKRVSLFTCDLSKDLSVGMLKELQDVSYVVHLAAETHVDNSISRPRDFIESNIMGTYSLLEFARNLPKLKGFLYFSTDEVFGPAPDGVAYKEWDRYNSTNPYSASKAGGEELTLAWGNTYGLPVFITHTMNCFGERQHQEKFIPLCVRKVLDGEFITIHSDPTKTKAGSRSYIHCRNVASAIDFLLPRFEQRQKYNIVGEKEVDNLTLAQMIADIVGKPLKYEMVDFHSSRPGHDLRYMLDGTKMADMGWKPPVAFEASLEKVVKWTLDNKKWLYGG